MVRLEKVWLRESISCYFCTVDAKYSCMHLVISFSFIDPMTHVSSSNFNHVGDVQTKKATTQTNARRRSSIKILMLPTAAVDEGWSWVVCIACFFINFVLIGVWSSFGVLYVGLLEHYVDSNETDICSSENRSQSSNAISGQTGTGVCCRYE